MESYHISNSDNEMGQESYEFSPEDLANIPCPDEISSQTGSSPEDYIELPLPPGTSEDDFPIPLLPKKELIKISNTFSPSLPVNKAFEDTSGHKLVPENLDILAFDDDGGQKIDVKEEDLSEVSTNKANDFLDDSKYSPSKVDSDEENQDFIAIKPKVLGKEQAKKRLMAFSLSKQPSTSAVKKQNKAAAPTKNKEKPPNPNKGSNVQEQFRATISAIEEEKKKMFQNMPSYLLLEMSELAKSSHSSMSTSAQLLEKLKNESTDSKNKEPVKDGSNSNKSSEREKPKRSFRRSRSRSNSRNGNKKRRRSRSKRRSRSRSRSKRSCSRSRRRSPSKTRRRSRSRRSREKNYKTDNKVLRERQSTPKKKLFENWNSFKAAGMILDSQSDEHRKRSPSPSYKSDFKPIFSYFDRRSSPMTSLRAKSLDSDSSSPALFSEKTIKFTRTKPILCWAENPSFATEYYMPKQMLLENCDETATSLLMPIMESKNVIYAENEGVLEAKLNRPWYPREGYLSNSSDTFKGTEASEPHLVKKATEADYMVQATSEAVKDKKKEVITDNEESKKGKSGLDKKISLVNDSYLSDEEDQVKEMIMGDVKLKMNLDMNRVKVRSKWDSDYEGENSEKETVLRREEKKKISADIEDEEITSKIKQMDELDIPPYHEALSASFENRKLSPSHFSSLSLESAKGDVSEITTGNLVSEYEEFLKMVSVEPSDNHENQKDKLLDSKLKTEKHKLKKQEKSNEENHKVRTPKLAFTDWDQESDHEDKTNSKKEHLASATASHDDFLLAKKNDKSDVKLEKSKKKPPKKKTEKLRPGKKKLLKKSSRIKKRKSDDSYSEDSTSDSYESESDSDSDSDDSDSSRKKKKKKKISKVKKKLKKDSSSESESDSDDRKTKKKKVKKKKSGKRRSSSSEDSEEVETTLIRQLDIKKQLIMKKIEEIDSVSDKSSKKKEIRVKKKEKDISDETDSDEDVKSGKKKRTELKAEKEKRKVKGRGKKGKLSGKGKRSKRSKSSSESESESESSDESTRRKKNKKTTKRKRDSSESSDTEERPKTKSKLSKSSKKGRKSKRDSSSSESDDSDDSKKAKKKTKKRSKVKSDDDSDEKVSKEPGPIFKGNLLLDEQDNKPEEKSAWERKKVWTEKNKKAKEDDDWEASSSVEESEKACKTRESSWDEEVASTKEAKSEGTPKTEKTAPVPEKEFTLSNSTNMSEAHNQLASETLKNSLSNFSFNENSFCSFGQELSRDFFLTECTYSNTGNESNGESLKTSLIEPRPFQSISKDSEIRKPTDSELYSPGYSDSELSEAEGNKIEKGNAENGKVDVYDPLNCDSEASAEANEIEVSSIPLPRVADILLPGELRNTENLVRPYPSASEGNVLKDLPRNEDEKLETKLPSTVSPVKSCFTASDFTPVVESQSPFSEEKITPTKRQLMSVKGHHKLISKAASVFQDESDEENVESLKKGGNLETAKSETTVGSNVQIPDGGKNKLGNDSFIEETVHTKKSKKEYRSRSREKSKEREERRRRSRSREKRESKAYSKKSSSPSRKRKSKSPELNRGKREIRSDSFEIEPLKSSIDSNELADMVQPIPVLTGLETSSTEGLWTRSLTSICEFSHSTDNLIDHSESFDIYPSEESKFRNKSYEKDHVDRDKTSMEKSRDQKSKKERRRSRSRSYSPRKKARSKSPERRKSPKSRSPRKKSASPKRRDKSPFSPRRRSPKRKSPSRRYKSSRSPDKRRKSPSRSPRKRRSSPSRRSRSASPRKYRSPKHRDESPRRKDSPRTFSPRDRFSPRKDLRYPQPYSEGLHNRIPVIGTSSEDVDMEMSPSAFPRHMPDPSVTEPEMYNSFYEGEYTNEFGVRSYTEEVGVNNLITVKNHDIEKPNSPERLSLDQRIELELRVPMSGSQSQSDQFQMPSQVCPPFQEVNQNHFQNSYTCDNANISNDNFYQNQNVQMSADFNGQYFNGHQQQQQPPPSYGSFPQYPNSQPVQNSVLQVGNIVEVVPTLQHPPPSLPSKSNQIMQVGNVLQVVPSQKTSTSVPPAYGAPDAAPLVKTQKATAVVAPSSIVPTPNPEIILNPLIKAIQLEREKRRKEKEKRKAEREARRKARQLRREAKLMSVNEKLKKSVQNEGLMLGQEVEDDELLDGLDVPSPPIPVEIITVSSPSALPPAGKGILITAGFVPKPPSEKKEVKFADGVCPGEGTSTSGGEEIASPPPKPKLPKEKRFKKKKTKVKKKVKVQIIRQIIQEEDDDEDDLSPPPPPPGDPPPVFFARFPFAGDAQFPVYQTQTTTTTTLTTVQYPAQTFE